MQTAVDKPIQPVEGLLEGLTVLALTNWLIILSDTKRLSIYGLYLPIISP